MRGPVIPDVYHLYSEFESRPIPRPDEFNPGIINAPTREFLDEVYDVYGQFSAWKLHNMTRDEEPWKSTSQGHVISLEKMGKFFSLQAEEAEEPE